MRGKTSNLGRFAAVAALVFSAIAPRADAQDVANDALVVALRGGGYVLLMRHASSPHDRPAASAAEPGNVNLERQLDEKGCATAQAMGAAFHRLQIPIGMVLSSPTYRALETLRCAGIEGAETFEQLGDGGTSMSPDAVAAWAGWLKARIAETPRVHSNTIIVTHMPNIASAFPDHAEGLSDGEALVFKPDGAGGATFVSRVKIEDWPQFEAPH